MMQMPMPRYDGCKATQLPDGNGLTDLVNSLAPLQSPVTASIKLEGQRREDPREQVSEME